MTNTLLVQPDSDFIRGVVAGGGGDLKKCYQCATCTSVCSLASGDRTFPRKQVIKAQWGLKDELIGDPGVWLCHNCGDCTSRCPRGARPGDIVGAIRREVIKAVAFPHFLGALASTPSAFALLLALPILVFGLIAVLPLRIDPGRPVEFAEVFPQARLEALFFTIAAVVTLAFIVGSFRLLRALRASGADGPLLRSIVPVVKEIITHERFSKCETERSRYWGHLLMLWGFAGLAVMGTIVGVGSLLGLMHTPLPLLSPLKIFANLCAVVVLAGVVVLLLNRLRDRDIRRASTYFDWFFLLTLAMVVVTGIASELLRLGQVATWMFVVYSVHLVLVFALFLYAPYSKFAHFLYRTIAMAATWERDESHTKLQSLPAETGVQLSS